MKLGLMVMLALFSFAAAAVDTACDDLLALHGAGTSLPKTLRVEYKAKLVLRPYYRDFEKRFYEKESPEHWKWMQEPREHLIDTTFSYDEVNIVVEAARRMNLDFAEALRRFIEVTQAYTFEIFEMGDPAPRVPTIAEVNHIFLLAEKQGTTPEGLFEDFATKLGQIDHSSTDYTYSTIASVFTKY